MQKKNFVSLILGTFGGIVFAIGMCMCLLPEWNAFYQGVVMGVIGAILLLVMFIVRRKMEGKPAIVLNAKAIGTILFGVISSLIFGVGMCMTMVWSQLLIQGIFVGVIGIVLLLCLIPMCKGMN